MSKENKVDLILENLVDSGSDKEEIKRLRDRAIETVSKDREFFEVVSEVGKITKENTQKFLYDTNKDGVRYIEGISSNILVHDFYKGDAGVNIIGGNTKRDNKGVDIDCNTLFDVASVTKLYTLVFAYMVENLGLNLNTKVGSIDKRYDLGDFTINDLIRLCGDIATNGRINDATSIDEAYQILRSSYLKSDSREENKYTDIGAMIIGEVLTVWLNDRFLVNYSLEFWMNKLLFESADLKNTMFNPDCINITGNGNNKGVHDPKAKALGGVAGHAGIFTNGKDLEKFAKELFGHYNGTKSNLLLTREQISKIGEITFPNSKQSNKGNLGVYVKHPLGFDKTFTPPHFSTGSFSHQGWTGALATFDLNNQIHQSILVNAIYESDDKDKVRNDKPVGYGGKFDQYLASITDDTMVMFIAKKYYDTYITKEKNDNNITFRI